MCSSRLFRLVFVLFALAPLSWADTLTVGPLGSGAQFTEIQAAIDAAHDDDVILVRAGNYQGIVVDKPLRILGEGSGTVAIATDESVIVRDIGAGEELILSGVVVKGFSAAVLLQDCPGTVVLQDMDMEVFGFLSCVTVDNCARAVLLDSHVTSAGFVGLSGVFVQDSTLWIANVEIIGGDLLREDASPGVQAVNSTLHVWRTSIRGGDLGGALGDDESSNMVGGPGIRAARSTVNLFGGPTSSVVGGRGGSVVVFDTFPLPGGPGLQLTQDSHARIQAGIFIQGGLNGDGTVQAPAVQTDGTSSFTFDPKVFPAFVSSARHTQLGSTFSLTLDGNPGGFQVLYLSLRTGPTRTLRGVDGLGLLDQTNLFHVASEVLPASGSFTVTTRVPNLSALLGATLFFQTAERFPDVLALRQSGPANRFAIGNPVLVTVTR